MTTWLRVRHVVDRLVAAAGLALASPVIAVLAFAIVREDGRPAIVGLPRVGRRGKAFRMWKLRTMRAAHADGTADGPVVAVQADPRVTRVGIRLRARRLDELPQLWNVVRGDMALIGPRPEAPAFVNSDDERWSTVLAVPPGVTGTTQLLVHEWEAATLSAADPAAAYAAEVLPLKLRLDDWYVRNATPRVDAAVVIETLRIASGRPAGRRLHAIGRRAGWPSGLEPR